MGPTAKAVGRRLCDTGRGSSALRRSIRTPRANSPRRRSPLLARHPVNGAWPAEMRADLVAGYLDFRNVRELALAIIRGEAPPPTSYRGKGRSREAVWAKVSLDNHVAPGIVVRQNHAKPNLAALV
jgi:hypothetical protein